MKKKHILYCLLLILLPTSCYKVSMNGKLDGMWQLLEIEKISGEYTDIKSRQRFYSIQLHLISFRQIGGSQYLGRFVYSGDSLLINDVRIAYSEDRLATKEQLLPFGLSDISERFKVEKITRSEMVLRSDSATLRFRKY
jgi:hypothetical protein